MIYLEATLRVVPGKMNEFMEVLEKEFLPASNKLGMKLVAQWRTTIGTLDEITDLWTYDDLSTGVAIPICIMVFGHTTFVPE